MPLVGDLSSFAVDEVIALLVSGGKSGRLSLVRDGDEGSLSFKQGAIVDAVHGSVRGSAALSDILTAYSSGHFAFSDGEHVDDSTMYVDAAQLSTMTVVRATGDRMPASALLDADEKLTVSLPSTGYPALTPLQWLLLAEIPRRCTLRHLAQDRDALAVKNALVALLHEGFVTGTGQILPPVATGVRLTVVKGYTREEEVVALDLDIVSGWRTAGCFSGKVSVAGQVFAAAGRQGLGESVVMSEAACRLCGVRDAQEVDVAPVT